MNENDNKYVNEVLKKLNELNAVERFPMNDRGSADLFATIFKNVSRYNPTKKDWMYYDKTRWTADTEGMRAKRNAKMLADVLVRYSVTASLPDDKRQSYIKYAAGMMNYRNRNVMITDAKDLNFFENTELDKDDFLINCRNCVLDLSEDQPKVLEHNADLLLSKICNASYNPAATCTLWEKTVNEIMQGDTAKIKYLQKMSGRFLTGDTSEEEFYIFFGATTRNGKSTITEILLYLLGDYATTISPESLAIKANKDSRTASPDIAKLAGTRLVVASEPPRRMLFDSSLVKTLTGRDTVSARFLHENEFQFKPKFKLILNSNYLPVISDKTVFSSNRVKVVPFERHFTEKEQNKHLKEQLQQEIDGILNWCIQGLSLYRKEGLEPPTAVQIATHEYSEDSDKIGKFISECLEKSDENLAAKDVYEKYSQWCNDCGLGVDGRTSFYEELKTKNLLSKTGTVKRLDALYQRAQMVMAVQADHAPFVSIAPWSFIKDECIVKYYPEGHYQKPEQITTTLHDALMIAQYYYECGLYVQFTMSLCIEWLFLFVRDDPRYSPPQQKSWYTKCTEEYPEITAMLESEQRSEIIGTLRRMPQNFLFKGLPDDIKDDYKLMDF